MGARAGGRRLPLAGRDPDALRRAGRSRAYLATLDRLEPLVEQADHVVPGHGGPIDGTRALAILREDRAYLEALLERGDDARCRSPAGTKAQRAIHAKNLTRR